MKEWIIEIMNNYGYVGIALLIAIENIFPPIPSEVILTFGGFMTTYGELNFWGVLI
ncbi:MAG TPA: DedA family protein, partial [Oscillospiraceae bacterium]|nr:DedA family protein [Oscillospiraceae bacterium]